MSKDIRLTPVDASFTLKDHIYNVLRDAIIEMDIYNPDTDLRLDERQVAERLGISRTPLREALVRLEQVGFVEVRPRKGVYVLRKTREEILEMITVWAALESMAARLAADLAHDEEIAELRALAAEFSSDSASAKISEYSETNIQFHQRILSLSRCSMLKSIADGLFLHMRAVRSRAIRERDRSTRSVIDHNNIINALEARDADLAATLVREHTMRLHEHVARTWSDLTSRG